MLLQFYISLTASIVYFYFCIRHWPFGCWLTDCLTHSQTRFAYFYYSVVGPQNQKYQEQFWINTSTSGRVMITLFVEHVAEDLFQEVDASMRRRVTLSTTTLLTRSRPRITFTTNETTQRRIILFNGWKMSKCWSRWKSAISIVHAHVAFAHAKSEYASSIKAEIHGPTWRHDGRTWADITVSGDVGSCRPVIMAGRCLDL